MPGIIKKLVYALDLNDSVNRTAPRVGVGDWVLAIGQDAVGPAGCSLNPARPGCLVFPAPSDSM